jgi:hypothetical protein
MAIYQYQTFYQSCFLLILFILFKQGSIVATTEPRQVRYYFISVNLLVILIRLVNNLQRKILTFFYSHESQKYRIEIGYVQRENFLSDMVFLFFLLVSIDRCIEFSFSNNNFINDFI